MNFSVKACILGLLGWSLYRQVFAQADAGLLWASFAGHFQWPNAGWLVAVLVLVPVNWGLEARKWQVLVRKFAALPFGRLYRAILAGLAVSLFTPNRIGEYAGRILLVEARHNWKAVVATLVGSLGQLWVILCAGLVGAVFFLQAVLGVEPYVLQLLFSLGSALVLCLLLFFFHIELGARLVRRLPFAGRLRKPLRHLGVLRRYTKRELTAVLGWSALRYAVYACQYFFMLQFFGVEVPLLKGLAGIATVYFIQSGVPLPPLMGLLARGEVALFVWGFFSSNEVDILAASYGLFLVNLAVPALLGGAVIAGVNVVEALAGPTEKEPTEASARVGVKP